MRGLDGRVAATAEVADESRPCVLDLEKAGSLGRGFVDAKGAHESQRGGDFLVGR